MSQPPASQSWDAGCYARNARFVAELAAPVVELLAPRPGERILDLGCGDGALTEQLAALGCAVVGVDSGPAMVEAARARGLDARLVDGQALSFEAEFDAVFSNAALHWMRAPDAVIAGVRRALRPRGRFVGEFGGHGNVAAITVALVAVLAARGVDGIGAIPWYFPTPEAYARKLQIHGFTVDRIDLIPRPTLLPTDMAGWLETFADPFFARLPAELRAAARDEALALLAPCLRDERGRWTADYVRLRFAAHLGEG
jgi:trans-aconitate methyltransferase